MALQGTFLFPRMARYIGTLQTNRNRYSVGDHPAIVNHDRFYRDIWENCQTTIRRSPLPIVSFFGHVALAIFFKRLAR